MDVLKKKSAEIMAYTYINNSAISIKFGTDLDSVSRWHNIIVLYVNLFTATWHW